MGRLTRTAIVSLMALALGQQAVAQDSIKFIDGGDLQMQEHNTPQPVPSLVKDKPAAPAVLTPPAESRAVRIQADPKQENVRVGIDIKLEESDRIELREAGRLSFQSDIGSVTGFSSAATAGPFGMRGGTIDQGLDTRSLFSKAASVNPGKALTGAAVRDPGAVSPRFAGFRIGYAVGLSADDPLGVAPSERGFEVYVSSAVVGQGLRSGAYLSESSLVYDTPAYNLGLNMGYRGFTVAASFLHGGGGSVVGYDAYDLGVSYDLGSWVTSVAVGGYFADRSPMMLAMVDVDQLYSVEIGAAYELRPGIRLLGRLKVFDSRSLLRTGPLDGMGGSFYLGTSFGF